MCRAKICLRLTVLSEASLFGGGIVGAPGFEIVLGGGAAALKCAGEALLYTPVRAVGLDLFQRHGVEEHRRLDVDEENEHHGADEQDKELHRDLRHGVEQKTQPALRDRFTRQIA